MNKTLIAIAIAGSFTLASCSSVPTPIVPDGSERTPINSAAKIEDFKARTAEETANYNERTALARQVDSLMTQIAELKAYVVMLQMGNDASRITGQKPPQAVAPAKSIQAPAKDVEAPEKTSQVTPQVAPKVIREGSETIVVRDNAIVFRVTHPYSKTDFKPTAALQEQLLKAAREGKQIEIRGRTDAQYENENDRNIAIERALKARLFLVKNGIEPSKIRWRYRAAGDNVADNTKLEGRALNRRVEIETIDVDPLILGLKPATTFVISTGTATSDKS